MHPEQLSIAVILDMLVTAPLAYLFLIRNSGISKTTVLRVITVGILLAGIALNNSSNGLLHIIKIWVSPVIECVVIYIIVRKFYYANRREYEANGREGSKTKYRVDFLTHCRAVMKEVIGSEKAGNILSSEVAVFYYAFFGKKINRPIIYPYFHLIKKRGIALMGNFSKFIFN